MKHVLTEIMALVEIRHN